MAALGNILCLAGISGVAYGVWLLSPAAGYIFVGLFVTATGVWIYKRHAQPARSQS